MFTETMLTSAKLTNGLGLTLLGMGVVFMLLTIISVVLDVLRIVVSALEHRSSTVSVNEGRNRNFNARVTPREKEAFVAVITAAVAAFAGTRSDGLIIKSIRPRIENNPLWSSVGRQLQMKPRSDIQTLRGK